MNWKDAVNSCKQTELTGWDMVEYVNHFVNSNMQYSVEIPMVLHRNAFARGKGYCVQQAFCVRDLLHELGYQVRAVYCRKAFFPKKNLTSGHTWCRVVINNEERDVCSCDALNRPGKVGFTTISKVRDYKGIVVLAGYLGSIPVCLKRKSTEA